MFSNRLLALNGYSPRVHDENGATVSNSFSLLEVARSLRLSSAPLPPPPTPPDGTVPRQSTPDAVAKALRLAANNKNVVLIPRNRPIPHPLRGYPYVHHCLVNKQNKTFNTFWSVVCCASTQTQPGPNLNANLAVTLRGCRSRKGWPRDMFRLRYSRKKRAV